MVAVIQSGGLYWHGLHERFAYKNVNAGCGQNYYYYVFMQWKIDAATKGSFSAFSRFCFWKNPHSCAHSFWIQWKVCLDFFSLLFNICVFNKCGKLTWIDKMYTLAMFLECCSNFNRISMFYRHWYTSNFPSALLLSTKQSTVCLQLFFSFSKASLICFFSIFFIKYWMCSLFWTRLSYLRRGEVAKQWEE